MPTPSPREAASMWGEVLPKLMPWGNSMLTHVFFAPTLTVGLPCCGYSPAARVELGSSHKILIQQSGSSSGKLTMETCIAPPYETTNRFNCPKERSSASTLRGALPQSWQHKADRARASYLIAYKPANTVGIVVRSDASVHTYRYDTAPRARPISSSAGSVCSIGCKPTAGHDAARGINQPARAQCRKPWDAFSLHTSKTYLARTLHEHTCQSQGRHSDEREHPTFRVRTSGTAANTHTPRGGSARPGTLFSARACSGTIR